MDEDNQSEGTNPDEDLQQPVKELNEEFFSDLYDNTTDLFRKYFKAIKKNRYLLTLIDDVLKEVDPCCLYPNTVTTDTKGRHKEYPLPSLSGDPQEGKPGASKKVQLTKIINKNTGLKAVSEINAGDNLVVEKAVIFRIVPNCCCHSLPHFSCYHCGNAIFKFALCEHCDICVFCDEKCLADAWNSYHEYECYGVQRHFWKDEESHMAFRMMLLCINDKAYEPSTKATEIMKRLEVFSSLETHLEKYPITELNEILHSSARSLVYLIERTNLCEQNMLISGITECQPYWLYMYIGGLLVQFACAARVGILKVPIEIVSADVGDYPQQHPAWVVSENAPRINHSCDPNCIVLLNKRHVIVRAIKDIKPEEELTISYYPIMQGMTCMERSQYYFEYFFQCICHVCLVPDDEKFFNTYLCRFCSLGRVTSLGNKGGVCIDCHEEYDDLEPFKKLETEADELFVEFKASKRLQCAIKALKVMDKVYYPFNDYLHSFYQHVYRCFLDYDGHFIKGCEIAMKSIDILYEHVGALAKNYGFVAYQTTLDVINHKNFTSTKWKPKHRLMLQQFKKALQDAHRLLLFYYEADQLEFLKEGVKQIDATLNKIKLG